ncbi:MAG TPA: hypothetical protein VMW67_04655 [Desulfobacteria bacterium]|nr:hypothetical protein [Desulfobacteria bacterium]
MVENCSLYEGWYCTGDIREYRDYYCSGGSCAYTVTSTENCSNNDGCYVYGDGCEVRDYYCSEGSCTYNYSNRQTDYYDDWVYYCSGDTVRKRRLFHNFSCDGEACANHTSWVDDQLVENCTDYAGWVDTGNTKWINDSSNECKVKEQKEQEYHDYTCSNGSCAYTVTAMQWVDTGNTKNKQDGTDCGSDYNDDWVYYCSSDLVRKHQLFHDFYCDGGACTDHTGMRDQLVENCNKYDGCYVYGDGCEVRDYYCSEGSCTYNYSNRHIDGWVDTNITRWVDDPSDQRKEKEQKEQEYHDYTCSNGSCAYTVTATKWVDTGNTRVFFSTGPSANPYPSLSGIHNGTITPFYDINVSTLYTYPSPGTGGHTGYVRIWNGTGWNVTATWDGYVGDWHNITFNQPFILRGNETYNYTIRTGSYPQIIHAESKDVVGGVITCTGFVDINGKRHEGWIPAIKLY